MKPKLEQKINWGAELNFDIMVPVNGKPDGAEIRKVLLDKINNLSDEELSSEIHLFNPMDEEFD